MSSELFFFNNQEYARGDHSPDAYIECMLEAVLEHFLAKYFEAISFFSDTVDLRISFSYFLNDQAMLKNQALETAE